MLPKGQQKLTKFSDPVEKGLSYLQLFLKLPESSWSHWNITFIWKLQKGWSTGFYLGPTLLLVSLIFGSTSWEQVNVVFYTLLVPKVTFLMPKGQHYLFQTNMKLLTVKTFFLIFQVMYSTSAQSWNNMRRLMEKSLNLHQWKRS